MTSVDRPLGAVASGVGETVRTWTLVALVMFLLNLVAYAGFSVAGGVWFTVSDALGFALAAAMVPVMVGMDRLVRPVVGDPARVARMVGVTGMVVVMAGSIVLLTSEVSHEFVPAGGGLGMQFVGFGLEGVWFLLMGRLASRAGIYSSRLATVCYLTGAGFLVGATGAAFGPDSVGVMVGMTLSFFGFIAWAVMSRRQIDG